MEIRLNVDAPPTLMYFEFSNEKGRYFQVYQHGVLLDDVYGIALLNTPNQYSLDFDREIGFTENQEPNQENENTNE